jgi:uncharacterized protein YdhG (YjbR/CyaY superfamily)
MPTLAAKKRAPRTIDEYLGSVSPAQREALETMRRAIRALAPKAEECISYGVAAFRLDGKVLVGLGATAKHCAFYPMSGSTIAAFGERLAGFETTKGSIKFLPDKPLPLALVKALTKSRIADIRS